MNIKDLITSSIEASLASEAGDIEIADDLQKTSAWLVAISTASIYFSFTQIQLLTKPINQIYFFSQVLVIILLSISFVAAYFFRSYYTTFRALCRNLVVGKKILLSQLYENSELIDKHLAKSKTPLFALVHSGQISEILPPLIGPQTEITLNKQAQVRARLDMWFALQKRTSLLGLLTMSFVVAYGAYIKLAA